MAEPMDNLDTSTHQAMPSRLDGVSAVVALASWGFLSWAVWASPIEWSANALALAAWFAAVILCVRSLAFPFAGGVLSLDTALYVAAAFCLGPTMAACMLALALVLDAGLRGWARRRNDPGASANDHDAGWLYGLYYGGVSAALLWMASWLCAPTLTATVDTGELVLRFAATAACFWFAHVAVSTVRAARHGRSAREFVATYVLPSMIAEAVAMPIAAVWVLLFAHESTLGWVLLSISYVVLHWLFSRRQALALAHAARVRELEILNESAHALAGALELERLVESVARATCRALPAVEQVALVHRGGGRDPDRLLVDAFDRATEQFSRHSIERDAGLVARVLRTGQTMRFADAPAESGVATDGARSWMAVPIRLDADVEGALVVQARAKDVFRQSDQRLLEAVGLQLASALRNAHLYEMAMVDGLTGLFVRRYFDARLDEEIARSLRFATPFSIVMIDIDSFKQLNDTHGHLLGDRVLRTIAATVRAQMRGVDTAARFGGEELALILPRTDLPAASRQAERVRAAIAELTIPVAVAPGAPTLHVTASFGIAGFPESGAKTSTELVASADAALYAAKRAGKNRVECAWPSSPDSAATVMPRTASARSA